MNDVSKIVETLPNHVKVLERNMNSVVHSLKNQCFVYQDMTSAANSATKFESNISSESKVLTPFR